jgi:hypothetical protein
LLVLVVNGACRSSKACLRYTSASILGVRATSHQLRDLGHHWNAILQRSGGSTHDPLDNRLLNCPDIGLAPCVENLVSYCRSEMHFCFRISRPSSVKTCMSDPQKSLQAGWNRGVIEFGKVHQQVACRPDTLRRGRLRGRSCSVNYASICVSSAHKAQPTSPDSVRLHVAD